MDVKKFLEDLKKTQDNLQATMTSLSKTIGDLSITQQECQNTQDKYDDFKQRFGDVMNQMAVKFSESISKTAAHKATGDEKGTKPSQISTKEAASLLSKKTKIIFLTGSGISVKSGLPTFRGKDGIWTHGSENYQCQSVCTQEFFQQQNETYWKWNNQFLQKFRDCKPNVNHFAIAQLKEFLKEGMVLVTQNIDGYHTDAQLKYTKAPAKSSFLDKNSQQYGICPDLFELHGNLHYMRCSFHCHQQLYDMPKVIDEKFQYPYCSKCQNRMRPHIVFFDEGYDNGYLQKELVTTLIEEADALVVIGTMLERGFAANIVRAFITAGKQIIEINPKIEIERGNSRWIDKKCEDVLPELVDELIKQKKQVNK